MTYLESLNFLGEARRFGMKLGLETMEALAERLKRPQDQLRFIHIAGTNGKGSTSAFTESCLRSLGYRVGLFTSPHLVSLRERIQINRENISEKDFTEGLSLIRNVSGPLQPTFFEWMTALALWYFAREKVDFVVWETGLGGRLDATNIVTPDVTVITNIGLDHQKYLGDTIRAISAEKAGILKPGCPLISAISNVEARQVVKNKAEALGCPVTWLHDLSLLKDLGVQEGRQMASLDGEKIELGLIGSHQVINASCAIAIMEILGKKYDWNNANLKSALILGLGKTFWAGRFQILRDHPLMVLDGAHNQNGIDYLLQTWFDFLASKVQIYRNELSRTHLVFACVADKNWSEIIKTLSPRVARVSVVRLANERSSNPHDLKNAFACKPVTLYESVAQLWMDLTSSSMDEPTLITGSLFLAGEILSEQNKSSNEYRYNERLETLTPHP